MSSVVSFDSQRSQDAALDVKGMATQLGINLAISVGVLLGFQLLRPKNTLIYAPRAKFGTNEITKPPQVGNGLFDWIKPVLHTKDDVLLQKIGFDAFIFLRILRILRHILYTMTFVGVCGLIPLNIIATSRTGVWPPGASIDFLSISTINNVNGKAPSNANYTWYWAHVAVTWIFTLAIFFFFYRGYVIYARIRQQYFTSPDYVASVHSKSILILNVPKECVNDSTLKRWAESIGIRSRIAEASIGHNSEKLSKLVVEHEQAVKQLEITLSSYLKDGKHVGKNRPTMNVGGFLGCGGRKVDAIDYYTKESSDLEKEIKTLRAHLGDQKASNYGWLAFDKISVAHSVARQLSDGKHFEAKYEKELDKPKVSIAPAADDVIWGNLGMNLAVRRTKRIIGMALYWALVFLWIIPITALSATSNIKNFLRLVDPSSTFATNFPILVGLIEQWFTPIVFSLFFTLFPYLLRYLSQQQGYISQTSLDRQVLSKLYAFFIINNLCVFSLSNMLIAIYGQIMDIIVHQGSGAHLAETVSQNVNQLAMNLTSVSNFWIATETTKALGITMDLAQLVPLVTITLRKFVTRPSPRQLQEIAKPSEFGYPQNYNLLLFFFTVGLVFSVMSPLIIPFTLAYFVIATMTFRYLLLYVYETKIETGGRMWRVVFNRVLASTILFQIVMIGVLNLKGGHLQSYTLIPLPFLTLLYKYLCSRQFDKKSDMYIPRRGEEEAILAKVQPTGRNSHLSSFAEPSRFTKLSTPTVHEDVKHLLPNVYHGKVHDSIKTVRDRKTHQTHTNHNTILESGDGVNIQFNSMNNEQIASEPLESAYGGVYGDRNSEDVDSESRLRLIKTNSGSQYDAQSSHMAYPADAVVHNSVNYGHMGQLPGGFIRSMPDPRSYSAETQYYTPEPEKMHVWPGSNNSYRESYELYNMPPNVPAHDNRYRDSAKELVEDDPVDFPDESTWDEKTEDVIYNDPDTMSFESSNLDLDYIQINRRNTEPCLSMANQTIDEDRRNTMPNIKIKSAVKSDDTKEQPLRSSTMPLSGRYPSNDHNVPRSHTLPPHMQTAVQQSRTGGNRWSTMTETGTGSRYDRVHYGGGYF
ncbi:hypothetical protein INT43_007264 [Umbelopsis isabellina]|uniref:DUF221-domain-containing protein n=1 Tax=Mortierella isabellina TaxID=91625 RepID=A0A8H7UKL6_MORIS|nr:hypothetical protein INT43_007264 [Umbelopsis isabellina]